MKNLILAGAVAAALGAAGVASAGPLAPSLTISGTGDFIGPNASTCVIGGNDFSCIAGEGAAVNTSIGDPNPIGGATVPDTAIQHLDWIVIHIGGGAVGTQDDYLYLYQVENSSIASLTSSNTTSLLGLYLLGSEFGTVNQGDLDIANLQTSTGHDQANFANLAVERTTPCLDPAIPCNGATKGERELSPQLGLITPAAVGTDGFQLAATFLPTAVAPGRESSVYGALGPGPVYGVFATIGTQFTWNSEETNPCTDGHLTCEQGVQIAVPGVPQVPEPASLLLLASGLLGVGAWGRRRRQS